MLPPRRVFRARPNPVLLLENDPLRMMLNLMKGLPLLGLLFLAPSMAEAQAGPQPLEVYRRAVLAERGDAERGRRLFEDSGKTRCILCHAVGDQGGKLGPGLMGVGGRYDRAGLLETILSPSATIHPDYGSSIVALKSGKIVQGIVRPVGDLEIEVATSATETVRIARTEIEEQQRSQVSFMPAGLHESLTPLEMADLLAYLGGLVPSGVGTLQEALDPREIPRALRPVAFRAIENREPAFHRPIWFGPMPGRPDTSVVVEMQRGRVWLIDREGRGSARSLFVDLGSDTTPGELTGLTSLAFHPDFVHNHRYFLKIHTPRGAGRLAVRIVERRATEDGSRDSGEPTKLILTIPIVSEIHNGGHLAFGPDGFLYVGMGDTGPQGDPRGHGQDLGTFLGKMLRIDVDHADGDRPYAIPADNPFRDRPGALPEIWAFGFREPWRFSFDPPTGDLWVGDVGQNQYEEVSIVRAGENLGWNVIEGIRPHSNRFASADARYVPPVFAYSHRVGPSVTGGFVYRGARQPALVGKYIFGDYETRRVWALEQRDRRITSIIEIGRSPERIASFGMDSEGELYVVGVDRGIIFRIDPTGLDLTPAAASREVVETSRRAGVPWRFTTDRPSTTWSDPAFDDASWTLAPGGFGTNGTPGAVVRTVWRTPDIWLRREFAMPKADLESLRLSVHHDEDAEIYINGVLALRLPGFRSDYDEFPIAREALDAIKPERNVLAVHCHQRNGGQYVDVGIVEMQGRRP
jgi:putative heme-binding domain-containing protein